MIAALGVYALMAYLAAQRTHEIGVRMALGATRRHVMTMFLRQSATLAFIGLALGAAGAWSLSSTATAFLFQIEPTDWRVFTATLVVLAVCAVTAGAIPARRAARVDPLVALSTSNRTGPDSAEDWGIAELARARRGPVPRWCQPGRFDHKCLSTTTSVRRPAHSGPIPGVPA